MTPEYRTRKAKDFKLIQNEDKTIKLSTTLKQEYPYIIQSMKYEKYKIEYEEYEILHELIYDDKVVGIMSLTNINSITRTICINEVYILPEYRHKAIFYETIMNLLCQPNMNITIKNPNKKIINLLLKYKLAKKLDNNIVLSFIDFYVEDTKIYTNKHIISKYENNYIKNEEVATDFYDLNINSCVFMEVNDLSDNTLNEAYIIKARLTDTKDEKYYNLLKNVDTIYITNLKERIFSIGKEEIKFIQNVQKRINEYININDILGTKNELSPLFKEKLKEYKLTEKEGQIIRSKVLRALKKEEIIPRSMIIRTLYLMENYRKDYSYNNNIFADNLIEENCPYCNEINLKTQEVCDKCGYNLSKNHKSSDNLLEELTDKIISAKLPSELILKEKKNLNQNKINNILKQKLNYLEYDEEEVYQIQSIIATYQFLKDIREIIYFDVYNYDLLNYIQEGSAYHFAKINELCEKLKNYQHYLKMMENCYSEKNLKKILKEHNYTTSGNKEDLILRIEKNINPKDIFGNKYILTKKGHEFIKDKDFIENYLENLSEFTFYEYLLFYEKNKEKPYEIMNNNFLKHMEELAVNSESYYKYHDIILHKMHSDGKISKKDLLKNFTLMFIIDINYWIISNDHRKTSKPLSKNVMNEFPAIKRLYLDEDIDDIFYEAINSIEISYLKTNEDFVKFYLVKSLEYPDIDDINREIEYNIFNEEYLMRFSY